MTILRNLHANLLPKAWLSLAYLKTQNTQVLRTKAWYDSQNVQSLSTSLFSKQSSLDSFLHDEIFCSTPCSKHRQPLASSLDSENSLINQSEQSSQKQYRNKTREPLPNYLLPKAFLCIDQLQITRNQNLKAGNMKNSLQLEASCELRKNHEDHLSFLGHKNDLDSEAKLCLVIKLTEQCVPNPYFNTPPLSNYLLPKAYFDSALTKPVNQKILLKKNSNLKILKKTYKKKYGLRSVPNPYFKQPNTTLNRRRNLRASRRNFFRLRLSKLNFR
jgi:hypothetical protein